MPSEKDPQGKLDEMVKAVEELRAIRAQLENELKKLRTSIDSSHNKVFTTEGG